MRNVISVFVLSSLFFGLSQVNLYIVWLFFTFNENKFLHLFKDLLLFAIAKKLFQENIMVKSSFIFIHDFLGEGRKNIRQIKPFFLPRSMFTTRKG
jgi:hypothetical protein